MSSMEVQTSGALSASANWPAAYAVNVYRTSTVVGRGGFSRYGSGCAELYLPKHCAIITCMEKTAGLSMLLADNDPLLVPVIEKVQASDRQDSRCRHDHVSLLRRW